MAARRFSTARHAFVQAAAAAFQRLGGQVEKVGAANPGGRGAGELPREQIDQGGKLPLRRAALPGVGQGGHRIDKKDVTGLILRFRACAASRREHRRPGRHGSARRPAVLPGRRRQAPRRPGRCGTSAAWSSRSGHRTAAGSAATGPASCRRAAGPGASVVSGSGQSTRTRFASDGRSCWTRSISRASMPKISGVSPGRQSRAGRVVVGRLRPERTSSAPARALISELLPVPVPPNVATISGDSRRTRREFSRPASRPMIAWQVSAGRHGGAECDQSSKRLARASISAKSSRWARSPVDISIR